MGHRVWVFTTSYGPVEALVIRSERNHFSAAITGRILQIIDRYQIDHLFWQYVPYSYHLKGIPVWLPNTMWQLSKSGVTQSVFFHEVSLRLMGEGFRHSIAAFLQRRIARKMATIALHSFTSIALYQSYFNKLVPALVPVGSNLPLPEPGIQPNNNVIACFANRADNALLEAVLRLRSTVPVILQLCGALDEKKRNQLEQWSAKNQAGSWLELTGELTAIDLAACIAAAGIFIQPQITDRNGRGGISTKNGTIMAAMSMGKPIITCKGDMTDPSIFKEEKNMIFVPYGKTTAYLEAMKDLLTNRIRAADLGREAYKTWDEFARWPIITAQLLPGRVVTR